MFHMNRTAEGDKSKGGDMRVASEWASVQVPGCGFGADSRCRSSGCSKYIIADVK
jgi:hypothetical protein